MSLLGSATLANLDTPYYGGGGGGPSGPNLVVSTIVSDSVAVSSLSAVAGVIAVPSDLNFTAATTLGFAVGGGSPDIEFAANNGEITGLSTINGAPYPPPGAVAAVSTITGDVWIATSTLTAFNPTPISVAAGKFYNVSLSITGYGVPTGAVAASDAITFYAGDVALETKSLADLSTLRGATNASVGFTCSGIVEATSNSLQFAAATNESCVASTFIATTPVGWAQVIG